MPFALANDHVSSISLDATPWIGTIAKQVTDVMILKIFSPKKISEIIGVFDSEQG
jgi:hypothetical protein